MSSILASGRLCSIALAIATATTALAEVKLHVGDVAPAFKVEEWLLPTEKGLDVDLTDGKVHVIEFWATWCRPCKFSIPHLSRLQEKWGEDRLQIIGISNEKMDVVEPWVKRNLSQIGYGIALSGKRGVQRSWFKAAGLEGIPAAFIVGPAGRVQFIGNPNDEKFEQTLIKVMHGRFDAAKTKEAAPLMKQLRKQKEFKNWAQYEKIAQEIIAIDPKVFIDIELDLFETRLVQMERSDAAYAGVKAYFETGIQTDPEGVLLYVDCIVLDPDIPDEKRDLDLALKSATQVLEQFEDPRRQAWALKTIAATHHQLGNTAAAVKFSQDAYRRAPADAKEDYREQWREYKRQIGS